MIKQISISFVGPIPGVDTSNIPLNPKRKNYPEVQYWKRDSWADLRRGASVTDSNSPIYSIFLEDEFGKLIPSAVQDSVRDNAASFWNGMHDAGNTPQTFSHTSLEVKDKFRSTLEGKHPWLRLCEENWKVNQVWRNYFTKWKISRFGPGQTTTKANGKGKGRATTDDLDDVPVIEIETSASDSPVGSKRGREEVADPIPSKKPKGGIPVPRRPARVQPKKTGAKVAKVSVLSILFGEHLLKVT